jgi:hypothetical protein
MGNSVRRTVDRFNNKNTHVVTLIKCAHLKSRAIDADDRQQQAQLIRTTQDGNNILNFKFQI